VNVPLLETWRRGRPGGQPDQPDQPDQVADGEGTDVCSLAELARRGRVVVSLPGLEVEVLVVKTALGVYAVENMCPHTGAELEGGFVHNATITCAAHGFRFDLGSGRRVGNRRRQTPSLTTLRAWIAGERVLVSAASCHRAQSA
jgi:3-phenylpropionate/trans-cinnamate dioxygenase ferredoxin component